MPRPRFRFQASALAAVLLAGAAASAHAGLFDDDEARKAILELRQRVLQHEEQTRSKQAEHAAAVASLQTQQGEQLAALRRTLVDLNNQIEALRTELARLRGQDELRQREIAELKAGQRELLAPLEARLKRIEPVKVSIDGQEALVEPAEKAAFDEAVASLRNAEFDKSAAQFGAFLRRFPASAYADGARFWLGQSLYGKREYKEAIAAFRAFHAGAPQHPKVPESWLAIANSQAEMRERAAAKKAYEELVRTYPQSEAAAAARERLANWK